MNMTMKPDRSRSGNSVRDQTNTQPAQRLRTAFAAVRVSFTWLGVRKSLSAEQKSQAAESFGAEGQYLSAAKKLLDTKHPAFAAVTSLRSQMISYWKNLSLPYPEPGVRLIRQDQIESFNQQLTQYRRLLDDAVANLDQHFESLKATASEQLGSLFNPADYPASLVGLFAVEWDFPSVEPPEYLLRLNPQLYQQETARISARFDQAVQLAEEAFVGELSKLVSHLTERLTEGVNGEKKVFRDSAMTNLAEFFTRFKSLNVGSNAELDRLVETAKQVLAGTEPEAVRNNSALRQQITTQLSAVAASLDGMLVDQPRRKILRGIRNGVSP
jgi:hypothetical protein